MMDGPEKKKWITSKEILVRAKISRATLNNYIKMGILPRPVIGKSEAVQRGSKQIGYFPEDVIERILEVQRMKQQGETMEEIAREFRETKPVAEAFPNGPDKDRRSSKTGYDPQDLPEETADTGLTLTIDDIQYPAYLVNYNFEIEWINQEAENQVFNKKIRSIPELESRNIFKLFFSWEFHANVHNWEEIIAFHIPFLKTGFPKSRIAHLYQGISGTEVKFLERTYDTQAAVSKGSIEKSPIKFNTKDGVSKSFKVLSMFFREGIFFVYVPSDIIVNEVMEILSQRGRIINELLKHRMPSLLSMCVLVADLQDSTKISAELLPEEYFELINQIWQQLDSTFNKYNAIYGKHAGDGMLYYFIQKPGSNYILDCIFCALELKSIMRTISSEWKLQKGWLNDLYLNIGINEGQEFFGTIRSASNIEFTALGDSINYAGRLSDFARHGTIWTTKNVINKLDQDGIGKIRFGIHRKQHGRQVFVQNSFSRIIDLLEMDHRDKNRFLDIITITVTEIL